VDSGVAPRLNENEIMPSVSHATLLVYPDQAYIWLLQDQKDGRPFRILPYAPSVTLRPSPDEIRSLLDKNELLEGLPVTQFYDPDKMKQPSTILSKASTSYDPSEVVGQVATADTILDYRPCR